MNTQASVFSVTEIQDKRVLPRIINWEAQTVSVLFSNVSPVHLVGT